jgi:acetyl-CoA acetyltransferase
MRKFEDDVVISGLGQSDVGRRLGRSALSLTLDAVTLAIDDAGLQPADIGALATYPGGGTALGPGFAGPPLIEVYDALGLDAQLLMGNFEGPAQLGPVLNAAMMVSTGMARHVVVYRTVTEGSSRALASATSTPGSPTALGGGAAPIGYALLARRHFHDHGTTREQLGQIAVTARKHAALNPKAIFREPLTLLEYLDARMIADPLCIYDCDVHCDGSTAVVLSHSDCSPDGRQPSVRVEAVGTAPPARVDYAQHTRLQPGARAAAAMWDRTELRPQDVDVAGLYDGFSILTLLWLEALGFCEPGDGGAFIEGGTRISLGGQLPINTNGGQLSGGRLHGLGLVHEMCLQLRGQAGSRQVPSAGVAAVSVGALPYVGCLLLRGSQA